MGIAKKINRTQIFMIIKLKDDLIFKGENFINHI